VSRILLFYLGQRVRCGSVYMTPEKLETKLTVAEVEAQRYLLGPDRADLPAALAKYLLQSTA
jgi:hypothetical protein